MRLAGHGRNLCLAGGLGFNALLVSALENRSGFENVFVQPVAGNAGTAIGAALETWHHLFRQEKRVRLDTLSLGPSYSAAETKQVLENCKLNFLYLLTCLLCSFTILTAAQQGEPLPDEKNTVADAKKKLDAAPKDVKLILELGKAQAAVWRADDAIATFTAGLTLEPENVTLLLERGHRYVSTRRWELAMKDLDQASKLVDQDAPEHYEIWYHIGVAQYLQGHFEDSADAWDRCRTLAKTDDQRAAAIPS